MGRGSRRSSPAPAPARAAPAPAAPARAPAPAPAPAHAPMASAPVAAAPAAPSMMQNVMTTALGVGIGHAVSSTLMSAMSGGERQQAVQEVQQNVPAGCNFQLESFQKCLDKSSDPASCQYIYDDLQSCKNSNKY